MFDSGLGGLSVLRALRERLPHEGYIYLADSAFCPYGEKDDATISERVHILAGELEVRGCKALVVACNTACSVAIASLRERYALPVIGLEPAVKPAAQRTKSRRIAVLATPRTARGAKLQALITTYASGIVVETIPAPGLVDMIESGRMTGRKVRYLLGELLEGPLARGCDVIVLGCTHYPFLAGPIAEIAGPSVAIVSSGAAVARRTQAVLLQRGMAAEATGAGRCCYLTTGDVSSFESVASDLLGVPIRAESIRVPAPSNAG